MASRARRRVQGADVVSEPDLVRRPGPTPSRVGPAQHDRRSSTGRRDSWVQGGRPRVVFGLTIEDGKIAEIDLLADPKSLDSLELELLDD